MQLVAQIDHFSRRLALPILLVAALLPAWSHFVARSPFYPGPVLPAGPDHHSSKAVSRPLQFPGRTRILIWLFSFTKASNPSATMLSSAMRFVTSLSAAK